MWLTILKRLISLQVTKGIRAGAAPIGPFVKSITLGVGTLVAALATFLLMVISLLSAAFLALAKLPYISATLYISLGLFVLFFILVTIGGQILRRATWKA